MAESLGSSEYDWFTPVDLQRVIKAVHKTQDWKRIVLVGGQSLTAWVECYHIQLPPFEGPYLTADADFLGTRAEAIVIARQLGSEAQIPDVDNHTPNAATIDFTGASGKKLQIDVMKVVDAATMPGQFSRSWNHDLAEVERKREIAARRRVSAD